MYNKEEEKIHLEYFNKEEKRRGSIVQCLNYLLCLVTLFLKKNIICDCRNELVRTSEEKVIRKYEVKNPRCQKPRGWDIQGLSMNIKYTKMSESDVSAKVKSSVN